MYNIAICALKDVEEIRFLTDKSLCKYEERYCLDICMNLDELKMVLEKKILSLLIVDDYINEHVDMIEKLRLQGFGPDIILLSEDEEKWKLGYKINAIDFIIKPCDPQRFMDAVKYSAATHERLMSTIKVKDIDSRHYFLNAQDIICIEIMNKDIVLNLSNGRTIHSRRTITDMDACKRLPFLRCHNSYYVNMDYAEEINRYSFTMKNGTKVPVSKIKYKQHAEKFNSYKNTM